jgi:UDP-glucose 4-epimerase
MDEVLVTGVAGFIGSNLAETLLERGHRVRGIDDFVTGRPSNLDPLRDHDSFRFHEGDVRDDSLLRNALDGVECIFHQAAVPSVPRSVEDPVATTDANCTGTATVLDGARRAGVGTVVVASSSSVYGSSETLPKVETMPTSPESPYALSKYYTEKLALQCSDLYDIDTVALRYFNVFGPRQDPEGEYAAVVPKFVSRMLDGKRPVVYGDGEQSRDFTYVDNAVRANVLAAESDVAGEAFNVACGGRVTVNELAATLNALLGTDLDPMYDDPRPGDVRHSQADISKARELLGYEPEVDFRDGLERTIRSMRS